MREKDAAAAHDEWPEPEDAPDDEHALRKRLRQEQPEGHDVKSGLKVEPGGSLLLVISYL